MINNYNSSGWRIDTHPETQLSNVIGSPPTSSGKSTSTSWLSSLFLLVFMLLGFNSFSQTAINYSLATTSGTFNSIASTGTSVAVAGDDIGINITGLPAFNVNGVNYINARMCSNGWLALYASTAPTVSTNYSSLSTAMPNGAVIFAPLSVDMDIASVGTTAAYRQTIGNENIFEWSNFARYSITGDSFSFQIRLDTVTGAVRFVYGAFTLGVSTSNAQVGWKTTGTTASNWLTDINNVSINITGSPTSCNWSNPNTGQASASSMYLNSVNNGIKPLSGLTYTWTKQTTPSPVRVYAATTAITQVGANLSWTAPTGANTYNVQYKSPTSCTWTSWSGNPVATNSLTLTGLTPATVYQVRVQANNTAGSTSSIFSHIPNTAGTGDGNSATGTFTTLANICSGTPTPGNTVSSVSTTCSGSTVSLSLQNTTAGSGVTYQWQSSATIGGTYANVTGATAASYLATITTPIFFKCVVTCAANSGTSNAVGISLNPFIDCYSSNFASSTADEDISNVTVGTLNNSSTCLAAAPGVGSVLNRYSNFKALAAPSLQQSATIPFSLTQTSCGGVFPNIFQIYIDYNQNGSFSDAGEKVYTQLALVSGNQTVTGSFIVPANALSGSTGMRVISIENGVSTSDYSITAYTYGETEDYTVNITLAPPCVAPPTAGTSSPAIIQACFGSSNSSALTLTGNSTGTGLTIQWEQSADGLTGWANATGTGATTISFVPSATATTYYRAKVSCSGSDEFTNVSQLTFVNCDYNVTRTTGITYNSLGAGGTGLTGFGSFDDSSSTATNIGFNFFYKGTTYTQFSANTNGLLSLGSATTSSLSNNLAGTELNKIAPFWDDLFVTGGGALTNIGNYIKYQLIGTAPNRILTVEWIGMEQFGNAGPNINFQVKLYETSNRIEIVHGQMQIFDGSTGTGNPYTYSMGISGPTGSTGTLKTLALVGENSSSFASTDAGTLSIPPACNVSYSFDSAAAYTGPTTFAYAAPANDNSAGAFALPVNATPCDNLCGTYYNSNLATASTETTACAVTMDDDVWFTFVASATGSAVISVKSASGNDAVVSVTDSAFATVGTLSCVNAVGNALTETLNPSGLTAGATYYVRVANNAAGSGNRSGFSICVSEVPATPSNDNPCGAVALTPSLTCAPYSDNTALTSTTASTTCVVSATTTTTNGVGTPTQPGALANVNDVWFKFTATSDYHGITVTAVPGFDVAVQAFGITAGTTCPTTLALTSLGTVNGGGSGATENIQFATTVGTEYYIRIFRHASGAAGTPVNGSQFSICIFNPVPACVVNTAPANAATAVSVTPTLTWPTTAFASSYEVYLGTTSGPTTLLTTVPSALGATTYSYTLTTGQALTELTQYYWYVKPKNVIGSAPCGVANQTTFTTAAVPVVVTSFAPATICSAGSNLERTVTITGSGFNTSTTVTVNGTPVQSVTFNSPTELVVVVASGATSGLASVIVTKASGSSPANTTGLTVNASPAPAAIAGGTEVCLGNPLTLTNTLVGGTWSSSDTSVATIGATGVITTVAAGVTTITYSVSNAGCTTAVTQLLTVTAPVIIVSSTPVQTITTGDNTSFVVVATGAASYQWQVDTNDLTGFNNISGATSATLALTAVPSNFDGYSYQCIVTGNGSCSPTTTTAASLNVGNIGITTNPANVDLCDNGSGSASFSVVTSGEVPTYQWQEDPGTNTYVNITNGGLYSGATSATLTLTGLTTANSGYNYRCIVTGNVLSITSNDAILTVNQSATITSSPSNSTVCYSGGSTSFTAVAGGAFTAYQWEYSTDNVTFAIVANGTPAGVTYTGVSTGTLAVTTTALTPNTGSNYYRATALASAPCTNVSSASAQLIIDTPAITAQPVAASVLIGNATSFTVATSAAVPTYQWQRAVTVGGSYSNVVNGTPSGVTYTGMMSATLNVSAAGNAVASAGNFLRCIVTNNGNCSVNTVGAQLTVANYCVPVTSNAGLDDSVVNTVITNTVTGANITQSSGVTFAAYTLYNNTPLVLGQLQTVSAALTFGGDLTQHSAIWIDYNQNGVFDASENVALSATPAGANGVVTYNFTIPLTATPGLTRLRIRGASDNLYTAGGACTLSSYGDTEDYFVNITAAPICAGTPATAVASASVTSICITGTTVLTATNISAGFIGISYQWFNSTGAISGANATSYTTPVLTASESYYFVVTCASSGSSSNSNTVTIGVNNPLVTGTTPATRCGTGTVALSAIGSLGTNLDWYAAATGGSPLASGATFTTPAIAATTTYYVGASIVSSAISGGKPSTTGADGVNTIGGLNFTANSTFNLNSVVMYPQGAGTNTIVLYAGTATTGTPIYTSNVTFTGATSTGVSVPLNWNIPAGSYTIYQSVSGANCFRDNGGASLPATSYPYNIGTACTITNATLAGFYYFFYNWSISPSCISPRIPVVATVTPAPALAISASAATICAGSSAPTVTITAGTADYDTFSWSPSTGVSGNATAGYTFNPTVTTTYTLSASQSTGLCAKTVPYTVTVNALPLVFSLTSTTNTVCTTDAPLLISAKPVNSTPVSGCLTGSFGEYPSGVSTATTCNGVTPTIISTLSYGGEYSTIATSANSKYVFTSSIATDYITITDDATTTVLAAGPTPLTWYSGSTAVNVLQWIFSDASCGEQQSARTKAYICGPIQSAVFTPASGLFTNAAGTTPYTGTAVLEVYAKPTATTAYTATATNAAGCTRTAAKTITVNTAVTWTVDADNDGYGANGGATQLACAQPTGYALLTGDCNDANANVNPGRAEVLYNGIDDNCDGNLDEGFQLKTKVQVAQCGQTLAAITSSVYAKDISYSSYRFRVTNNTTSTVQTLVRPNHWFRIVDLSTYDYGTTYTVEIEIQRLGVWLGYYGDACTVTTPTAASVSGVSTLTTASCGSTLVALNQSIYTNLASGVTGYKYRISGGTQPLEVITRTQQWFTLAQFPTVRTYGTTYDVQVAVKTTGDYGPYGPVCNITTPNAPSLTAASCGATIASKITAINAVVSTSVTRYRFQVTNTVTSQVQVVDRVPAYFNLLQLPSGYTVSTVYSVKVAVETGNLGLFSPYGAACNITTPATLTAKGEDIVATNVTDVVAQDFKVIALPNPYTTTFGLDIQSFTDGQVGIKIYDMIGKLLESREVKFDEVMNQSMGESYPAGVYNIVVSQGENTQTLRVIKK